MTNSSPEPGKHQASVADAQGAMLRLLHTMHDPACVYEPDGTLLYVNNAFDELHRITHPEGTTGLRLQDIEPDKADELTGLLHTNRTRRPEDPELVFESPSTTHEGEVLWLEWRCLHEFDDDGNVSRIAAISRDHTSKRRTEAQAKRAAERLQESNRDLLEFAQVASHDLQEPLRKVIAFSGRIEASLGDDLNDRTRDYMQRMGGAVERMQRLIDDLLTFSRVNTRSSDMERVSLNAIVEDVCTDLEIAVQESGAVLEISNLPTLPVDATQIRQLFQNLIGNALKFRRDGVAPVVRVEASHVLPSTLGGDEPPMGWYDIEVSDNGIGFDNEYASSIFAPFKRLHGRNQYEGTGVGLSVCRRIVERHQGSILALSPGAFGSTFVVRLPTAHFRSLDQDGEIAEGDLDQASQIGLAAA